MNDWPQWSDLIFFLLGIVTYQLAKYVWSHRRFKRTFKWKCDRCNFKIKTDNYETYHISVTSHNHSSLKEFRRNGL